MRVKLKLHRPWLGMADIGHHTSFQRITDVARPNPWLQATADHAGGVGSQSEAAAPEP
jgi:hypothetical protein